MDANLDSLVKLMERAADALVEQSVRELTQAESDTLEDIRHEAIRLMQAVDGLRAARSAREDARHREAIRLIHEEDEHGR